MLELSEIYEDPSIMTQVKAAFQESGDIKNIKIDFFFADPYVLLDLLSLIRFEHKKYPLHHDYYEAELPTDVVAKLQVVLVTLLKEFNLTTLRKASVTKLTHKSYSMLSDEKSSEKKDTFDIVLDFSEEWDEGFGGSIIYASNDVEPLDVEPGFNSVFLVHKKAGMKKFYKYCNHYSKDYERIFITLSFETP